MKNHSLFPILCVSFENSQWFLHFILTFSTLKCHYLRTIILELVAFCSLATISLMNCLCCCMLMYWFLLYVAVCCCMSSWVTIYYEARWLFAIKLDDYLLWNWMTIYYWDDHWYPLKQLLITKAVVVTVQN